MILKPGAQRDLKRLDNPVRKRVAVALDRLLENPRHHGVTPLVEGENVYRVRVGEWRIIFEIADNESLVTVSRIRHRRDAYR